MDNCKANGCPCPATLHHLCTYHNEAIPKDWGFVTEKLNQNLRLLKAISWAYETGRYRDNETVRKTLTRLTGEYPDLEPYSDDSAMTWAYRAVAWMSKQCRPVSYGDMTGKIRISAIRQKYFPKTVEEFKEAAE